MIASKGVSRIPDRLFGRKNLSALPHLISKIILSYFWGSFFLDINFHFLVVPTGRLYLAWGGGRNLPFSPLIAPFWALILCTFISKIIPDLWGAVRRLQKTDCRNSETKLGWFLVIIHRTILFFQERINLLFWGGVGYPYTWLGAKSVPFIINIILHYYIGT